MHRSWLSVLIASWILLSLGYASGDVFDLIDTDQNGAIDKNEFGSYISQLKTALNPLLEFTPDLKTTESWSLSKVLALFQSQGTDFVAGFVNSLGMILVTEIGDKTFFIAAVLSMRNGRIVVYLGAMGALAIMHLLSSLMGFALPSLMPRTYTHYASALLFVYFGIKLLKDAYDMNSEGPSEELQEVEEELINKKGGDGDDVEKGTKKQQSAGRFTELEVFTQAFTLTFLAEWGDRSQIATIALAASKNVFGVFFGGLIGHAFCTGLAVIGGRLLAARISERTVAIVGGILFLAFAVHSFAVGPDV